MLTLSTPIHHAIAKQSNEAKFRRNILYFCRKNCLKFSEKLSGPFTVSNKTFYSKTLSYSWSILEGKKKHFIPEIVHLAETFKIASITSGYKQNQNGWRSWSEQKCEKICIGYNYLQVKIWQINYLKSTACMFPIAFKIFLISFNTIKTIQDKKYLTLFIKAVSQNPFISIDKK